MLQRTQWEPFKSKQFQFTIHPKELKDNSEELRKWIKQDQYFILFKRQQNPDLYKIEFIWMNKPKIWEYDLLINVYKEENGNSETLTNNPVVITSYEESKILFTLDISKFQSSSDTREEVKEIYPTENKSKNKFILLLIKNEIVR